MTGKDKIHMIMLLHHLKSLEMMTHGCKPIPLSKASAVLDEYDEYFYYDDNSPREVAGSVSYPVMFFGYDPNDEYYKDDPAHEHYMENASELEGLYIDLVFCEPDNHDRFYIKVYDDDYAEGKTSDSVLIMDGEITL